MLWFCKYLEGNHRNQCTYLKKTFTFIEVHYSEWIYVYAIFIPIKEEAKPCIEASSRRRRRYKDCWHKKTERLTMSKTMANIKGILLQVLFFVIKRKCLRKTEYMCRKLNGTVNNFNSFTCKDPDDDNNSSDSKEISSLTT